MRITQLEIDGFGIWSDVRLDDLSEELTVFYGPNEAGKTTLMQFVRSMLYGFSPERRARYLPPVHGDRSGGAIRIVGDNGAPVVLRRRPDEGDDTGPGTFVLEQNDALGDTRWLAEALGDVDEQIFNNIFAFGLREIQELGLLGGSEAAQALYELTLGLDRVSLLDVMREVESSRVRLLAPDDRTSLVGQLLAQRERLQAETSQTRGLTKQYLDAVRARRQVEHDIIEVERDYAALERNARLVDLAWALRNAWHRRGALTEQLAAVPTGDPLPDDAIARLDRLNELLAEKRARHRKAARRRKRLGAQIAALAIDDALSRNALRIEALAEQQSWIAALAGQLQQFEASVKQLEAQCGYGDAAIDVVATPPVAPRVLARLRALANNYRAARRAARTTAEETALRREAAQQQAQQIRTALASRGEDNLVKAIERAGELVSQLRHRVQIDERLDQLGRREVELEEQSRQWAERQLLPGWVLGGLGAFFVLGCLLIFLFVAGRVLPASIGILGWPMAVLGFGACAVSAATKILMERAAAQQLDNTNQQVDRIGQQVKQARDDRDKLDQLLPPGGGPIVSRLQTAERELAALEALVPLQSQRDAADRESQAADQRCQTTQSELIKSRQRWREALSEAGLPSNLHPKQLHAFCQHQRKVRGRLRRLEAQRQQLDDRRREFGVSVARIDQLCTDVGLLSAARDPLERLKQLIARLREQEGRLKQREALRHEVARARRRQARVSEAAQRIRLRRRRLLRMSGTEDESEFRRRAAAQGEQQRLRDEHAGLSAEIGAALGRTAEAEIAGYLAAGHDLARTRDDLALALQSAGGRLSTLRERRGALGFELEALANDRRPAEKQLELAALEKRLKEALDRWRVLASCEMVLESVRDYYERERQPEALQEASKYLERFTGGRYTRVWTPLGKHELLVDEANGDALRVEVLSRGTREQLFLSLRLALISAYARRAIELPVVLDDVLVNFDADRAKAAASVLRDFAKAGHQLMVFTCHEHIAKTFKSMRADVRTLPDHGRSVAAHGATTTPARRLTRPGADTRPSAIARRPAAAKVEPATKPAARNSTLADARPSRRTPKPHIKPVARDADELEGELADRVLRRPPTKQNSTPDGAVNASIPPDVLAEEDDLRALGAAARDAWPSDDEPFIASDEDDAADTS